jgi:hypothetical protein
VRITAHQHDRARARDVIERCDGGWLGPRCRTVAAADQEVRPAAGGRDPAQCRRAIAATREVEAGALARPLAQVHVGVPEPWDQPATRDVEDVLAAGGHETGADLHDEVTVQPAGAGRSTGTSLTSRSSMP